MSESPITVKIADRHYQLKVAPEDEKIIRDAEKAIDELVKRYSEIYAYKDKQDLLAMVALNFATNALNTEIKYKVAENKILSRLTQIDHHITENSDLENSSVL